MKVLHFCSYYRPLGGAEKLLFNVLDLLEHNGVENVIVAPEVASNGPTGLRKEYFVDLLFYHRFLKALVAFDLKIGSFEPEHAGKMDFYLNLLNEKERAPGDQPSIGIILCAEKDDIEVEFALKTKTNPIGVAEYQLQARLPAEFKGRLPTAKQLADAVREVLPLRK